MLRAARVSAVLLFVMAFAYWPHLDAEDEIRPREEVVWWEMTKAYVDLWTGDLPGYRYPLHYDEFVHWSEAAGIQRRDGLDEGLSLRGLVHERGFHVALVGFQDVTGIPWLRILQFGPALAAGFTAFAVYAMLRGHPAALPAAALTAIMPTTPRFLGPSFLVPVAVALAWVAVAVMLATARGPRRVRLGLLAVVVAWTFFLHFIIGFVSILVLVGLLGAKGLRGETAGIRAVLVAAVPFAVFALVFFGDVVHEFTRGADRSRLLAFTPRVFNNFGVRTMYFWTGAATWIVLTRKPKAENDVPLAFTFAGAAMLALIAWSLATETGLYILYDRWHVPFFFAAVITVGAGVAATTGSAAARLARLLKGPRWEPRLREVRPAFAFGLAAFLVLSAAPFLATEPYYEVLQDADWAAISWIGENLGPEYHTVLSKRLAGPAVTAVSGKCVYRFDSPLYASYFATPAENRSAFLLNRGITVVVRTVVPTGDAFHEVAPDVWAVDHATALRLVPATDERTC